MITRAPSSVWPKLLTPAPGCLPPIAELRRTERVLHVALYPSYDILNSLPRAFNRIATAYVQVDHMPLAGSPGALYEQMLLEADRIKPTIIFMHMQYAADLDAERMLEVRRKCNPGCVTVQWDGDMHWPPKSVHRQWFVDLGKIIDASLTAETHYQEEYAALGVKRPGFLAAGCDHEIWQARVPTPGTPPIVFLASYWPVAKGPLGDGYQTRVAVATALQQQYPGQFGLYGAGWQGWECHRAPLALMAEAGTYSAADAAISISITNGITRYTSDRLMRMLCSGAVCLVERFPDCEGLGLEHGVNCLLWSTWEELKAQVDSILASRGAPRWTAMRTAAAELGKLHTWDARILELLAIVDAVRSSR